MFRDGQIIRLRAFGRAEAIRAGAEKNRRARVILGEQVQCRQRPNFPSGGVEFNADLQSRQQTIIRGKPPARAFEAGVDVATGKIPFGFQTAPTERRALAGSAASGRRLRNRARPFRLVLPVQRRYGYCQ